MKQPTIQTENEHYQSIDVFEVLDETFACSITQPLGSPNDKCAAPENHCEKLRVIDYLVIPETPHLDSLAIFF